MQDVPKIVRERLQRAGSAESHPDANSLAAFAEQSLAASERENVVRHLAECGECREIVTLALPETEVAPLPAFENRTRANWMRWPALRWAVVAAGILVVTSVGVLQFRQRAGRTQIATRLVAEKQSAAVEKSVPPSLSTSSMPASSPLPTARARQAESEKKSAASAGKAVAADKTVAANAPILPGSNSARRGVAGGVGSGSSAGMAVGGSLRRDLAPNHALAYAPAAQSASNVAAAKQNPPVPSSSEAVEVSGAAPLMQTETASNATRDQFARNQSSDTLQLSGRQNEAVVRAKPTLAQDSSGLAAAGLQKNVTLLKTAAPRWTISASGALQRSLDGGKTWLDVNLAADISANSNLVGQSKSEQSKSEMVRVIPAQPRSAKRADAKSVPAPPVPVIFRALSVSSNAAEVWAGGAAGVLYHTMDGGDLWVRVVPSDGGVALTGDIVSVEFSDPRNGTVATSNGSVWTTNDGGQSWHKLQ